MAASLRNRKPYNYKVGRSYMGNQPKKANTVAWCRHFKHTGALSLKMMQNHECLRKQCPYLTKNETHPYWEVRRMKKETKKLAKISA